MMRLEKMVVKMMVLLMITSLRNAHAHNIEYSEKIGGNLKGNANFVERTSSSNDSLINFKNESDNNNYKHLLEKENIYEEASRLFDRITQGGNGNNEVYSRGLYENVSEFAGVASIVSRGIAEENRNVYNWEQRTQEARIIGELAHTNHRS